MAKQKETALTAREKAEIAISGYHHLAAMDMAAMMAEELNGLDAGFERIKISSAESTVFEVPGEDPGKPEATREFSAVILKQRYNRYLRKYCA